MRENVAVALLKWVALICFGVGCQRMALAGPSGNASPNDIAASGGAGVIRVPPPGFPVARSKPELIITAQADSAGSDAMVMDEATAPSRTSGSLMSAPESISAARQSSSMHRRRKPRMAGVPPGSQPLAQSPEIVTPAIQQMAQDAEKINSQVTQPIGEPGLQKTIAPAAQQAAADDSEEAPDIYTPGAIAQRQAAISQGLVAKKYRLAPIKWGGTITEAVGMRRMMTMASPGGSWLNPTATPGIDVSDLFHVQTLQVGAETYVMQPWIATVRGRFGVMSGTQSIVGGANDTRRNTLFGGGDLALFNQSRFPFTMKLDVNDKRDITNVAETTDNGDTAEKKLRMEQLYRTLDEISQSTVTYENSATTVQTLATYFAQKQPARSAYSTYTSTNSILTGTFSTKLGVSHDQPFNAYGSLATYGFSAKGGAATVGHVNSMNANHVYMPEDSLLTLRTSGGMFQSRYAGRASSNLQARTSVTWQPEAEDNPLIVRGGLQAFSARNEIAGALSKTQSLGGNVLLDYSAWADRKLSGGGTVALTSSNGISSLSTTQYGRGDYYPPSLSYGSASYSRSFNAGFQRQTTTNTVSNLGFYGGATHSLGMPFSFSLFGYNSGLSSNISQSLNANVDNINGATEILAHSGTITWKSGLSKRLPSSRNKIGEIKETSDGAAGAQALLGLGFYDTSVFGKTPSHGRAITLTAGLSGLGDYKAKAKGYGAKGDLTINTTYRQGKGAANASANVLWGWDTQYDYNYKINKRKFLGVNGLDYYLAFMAKASTGLGAQRSQTMVAGAAKAGAGATTTAYNIGYDLTLNQGLRYRIGQNEVLLTAALDDNYGIKTASLFLQFRAWRNFGN